MPLYEYQCQQCGHRFELIRKFSDPPVETCPKCGGPVEKLIAAPAFQLKGTGWYITDYARKDGAAKNEGGSKESSKGTGDQSSAGNDASSESKKDSKSETGSESKTESKKDGGKDGGKAAPAASSSDSGSSASKT